jgi:hypothetical protein
MAAVGQALFWSVATESDLPAAANARGGESSALFGKFSVGEAEVKMVLGVAVKARLLYDSVRLKAKYSQFVSRTAPFTTDV